jgi:Na+/melibiose symporter-like transporter
MPQMAAFAGPSVLLFLYRAASYMLPALYAARFKFDLADLAAILLAMRTVELALQLPAGMVSDAIRHPRWGRKPAVFACVVLGGVATFMLYRPPADATLVYFGVWIALATLAGSLAEVGYGAWATEITTEYRERGRCATYQAWASIVGKELFSIVPLLWFVSSKRMSFESLGVLGWILVGLVPLIVAWSWFGAPAGQTPVRTERVRWRQVWDIVLHNRPLHVVLVIALFWEVGSGLYFGLDFMRIDSYLHAGQAVPYQGLLGVWAGAAGLALFQWLVRRHDKHRLWALSMVGLAMSWLPQLLLSPGQSGLVPILVGFTLLMYFFAAGVVVVPMAAACQQAQRRRLGAFVGHREPLRVQAGAAQLRPDRGFRHPVLRLGPACSAAADCRGRRMDAIPDHAGPPPGHRARPRAAQPSSRRTCSASVTSP